MRNKVKNKINSVLYKQSEGKLTLDEVITELYLIMTTHGLSDFEFCDYLVKLEQSLLADRLGKMVEKRMLRLLED